jgi:hypothetical protein
LLDARRPTIDAFEIGTRDFVAQKGFHWLLP